MAYKFLCTALTLTLLAPTVLSQHCEGQSCTIAALSGSSGQKYDPKTTPTGGSNNGTCCVLHYNPSAAPEIYKEKPGLKKYCAAHPQTKRAELAYTEVAKIKRAACTPYTLIYSKGTGESGDFGESVGPVLKNDLALKSPGDWTFHGVDYSNTVAGDDCLGLPGGMIAAKILETTAKSCPNTKIVVSGYSEGAMVSHNAVAYATAAARERGVVVFGDPFDGAPIKDYSGPIKTYCAKNDHVCDGEFDIGAAHLSYAATDTGKAADYITALVTK